MILSLVLELTAVLCLWFYPCFVLWLNLWLWWRHFRYSNHSPFPPKVLSVCTAAGQSLRRNNELFPPPPSHPLNSHQCNEHRTLVCMYSVGHKCHTSVMITLHTIAPTFSPTLTPLQWTMCTVESTHTPVQCPLNNVHKRQRSSSTEHKIVHWTHPLTHSRLNSFHCKDAYYKYTLQHWK